MLELIEAWQLWTVGRLPDGFLLWGWPIAWWGRGGKLISFTSALVIVVDLIGVPRFRAFGASLHQIFSPGFARRNILDSFVLFREMVASYFSGMAYAGSLKHKGAYSFSSEDFYDEAERHSQRAKRTRFYKLNLPFAILLALGYIVVRFESLTTYKILGLLKILVIFIAAFYLVVPLCILVAASIINGFLSLIDYLLIKPIAFVLEHPYLEKWAKFISLVCLVLGFHFDLLAS